MPSYSTIRGRYTTALLDEADTNLVPLTGQIVLTPSVKAVLTTENGEPVTVLPTRVVIDLDVNGVVPNTEVLASNTPGATPQNFTWEIHHKLKTLDGRPVTLDSFNFLAPSDEVVDLTNVTPVERYEGVQITRGVDGIGVEGFTLVDTTMTMTLSDGSTQTVEVPAVAVDGRGIAYMTDNGDSTLTVTYDDDTTFGPITIPTVEGPIGQTGASAYETAVSQGFTGSESEWIASLEGPVGPSGLDGSDGRSAYQVALDNGFVGTEADFINSLEGPEGTRGSRWYSTADYPSYSDVVDPLPGDMFVTDTGLVWQRGETSWFKTITIVGTDGYSAYEVAVADGFTGSQTEWLASLEGEAGINATITGATATELTSGATPTVDLGGTESARTFAFGIPAGPAGVNGTRGATWYVSGQNGVTTSTTSVTGMIEGDIHLNASTGAISRYTSGAWASAGSIKGPTGNTGTRGATWYIAGQGTVTSSPSSVTGMINNDLHLDPATGIVSRYATSTTSWTNVGSIKGPKGDTGEQGLPGTNGTTIYVQETEPTGAVAGELWVW